MTVSLSHPEAVRINIAKKHASFTAARIRVIMSIYFAVQPKEAQKITPHFSRYQTKLSFSCINLGHARVLLLDVGKFALQRPQNFARKTGDDFQGNPEQLVHGLRYATEKQDSMSPPPKAHPFPACRV